VHDLIVVGAGPCGLSAAVEARTRDLDCLTLDRGCLCDSVTRYPTHMTFFSTPDLLEVGGVPFALDHKPLRHEILTYYRRVAAHFDLPLALYTPALEIRPCGGGFSVRTPDGEHRARAVCVATGFFDNPRRLGAPGEDLPHVSHHYREGHPFFRRDVVVVGTRNSAAEAALDLHRSGARVTLVGRGQGLHPNVKYWLRPDLENRIREGSVRAIFGASVARIEPGRVTVAALDDPGRTVAVPADHVFLMIGYVPDYSLLAGAGATLAQGRPRYDPQTHETDVPGLFVAGVQADPGSIIEEGRFHGRRVAETLARRLGR
jgi:thioredoxin reductase (NADPH)